MAKSNQSISKLPAAKDSIGESHALFQNFVFAIEVNTASGEFFCALAARARSCVTRRAQLSGSRMTTFRITRSPGGKDLALSELSVLVTQSRGA